MALGRGPGGGPQRRERTQWRASGNTMTVSLRRSEHRLPSNWRELLIQTVKNFCEPKPNPDLLELIGGTEKTPAPTPRPGFLIPAGSLPDTSVIFVLDLRRDIAREQKHVIDQALQLCDVTDWTLPTYSVRHVQGETWIRTSLYLVGNFDGYTRHEFNAHRLKDVPGINWKHLEQYTARRKKSRLLGIRTICGKPCGCQRAIVDLWHFGWEMQY